MKMANGWNGGSGVNITLKRHTPRLPGVVCKKVGVQLFWADDNNGRPPHGYGTPANGPDKDGDARRGLSVYRGSD